MRVSNWCVAWELPRTNMQWKIVLVKGNLNNSWYLIILFNATTNVIRLQIFVLICIIVCHRMREFNNFIQIIVTSSGAMLTYFREQAYYFKGSCLQCFSSLVCLRNLSSNQLTGSIPPSIWNISTLNTLDLSKNSLFGNLITTSTTPCPENLIYL
jgi:predicted CDP-diglyceride synthetase/phosphatidate cytidylyltransferase